MVYTCDSANVYRMPKAKFNLIAFYQAINDTRHRLNLTWQQVSEQSGVSPSTLSRLKRGCDVSLDNLAALINWGSFDFANFIEREENAWNYH